MNTWFVVIALFVGFSGHAQALPTEADVNRAIEVQNNPAEAAAQAKRLKLPKTDSEKAEAISRCQTSLKSFFRYLDAPEEDVQKVDEHLMDGASAEEKETACKAMLASLEKFSGI